jgi:5S rRNA maturation endonuclease (ribonuclease M5)
MGKLDPEVIQSRLKRLRKIMAELEDNWLFVEGLKDKKALEKLGLRRIKTISGNLRQSCRELDGVAQYVIVLTDLDRRGDQLMRAAKDELEALSIKADTETRRQLAAILALRYFEDIERKYKEFMKIVEENNLGE